MRMLLVASILLLMECFPGYLAAQRLCTPEERCLRVPANICDNSKCLIVDNEEMNTLTQTGTRMYTWNICRKVWNEYCSPVYTTNLAKSKTGATTINQDFTFFSGPACNTSTLRSSVLEPIYDDCTGEIQFTKSKLDNGHVFEECIIYFEPGVALVYRRCLAEPPRNGQACAAVFVREAESGNCNREKLQNFLQQLGMDFPQIVTDCL